MLAASIQFGRGKVRDRAQLFDRNIARLTRCRIKNLSPVAPELFETVDAQLPQHPTAGLQLQPKRRIRKRCVRKRFSADLAINCQQGMLLDIKC
jgi:hypothetical protein